MKKDLNWFIVAENKQVDENLPKIEELVLSPTYSQHDRLIEEFNSFWEANKAFKFYQTLLLKEPK